MKEYQRYLTPGFESFDPLELAKETEKIVTRMGEEGLERKYAGIYSAPVYLFTNHKITQISTKKQ